MLNINKWLKTHASEFINNDNLNINELENLMIHFAREHVEAALKEADIKGSEYMSGGANYEEYQQSIINSYPLENIK